MTGVRPIRRFIVFSALAGFVTAMALAQPAGPVDFGRRAVQEALAEQGLKATVDLTMTGTGVPESYEISFKNGGAVIRGADANGVLYGALALAERIQRRGREALSGPPVSGKPFLHDRGWNLFITLPWNDATANTDYDQSALTDPARWWFANDGFWRTLLDQMAGARLNWLDIHGMWDISVTDAPNLYAYFIQSDRFPKVGVAPSTKAANLRRLHKIIGMAHARGIRVSLMAYEAHFRTPHAPNPYPENEADLYAYTREVVEKMIRQVPELDAIGFRIGESGHGEAFFNSYIEAVRASGRDIPLITRSWLARKSRVVALAKAAKDFTVEIKYNGEQWGAPYMVMGGRMAGWYSYSFEDYLSDSQVPDAARLWPGNPAIRGGRWPAEPYKLVWQVRANGTHRLLPIYNPEWVRRAVRSMPLGTASGFVVESLDTYYPKTQAYYLADARDSSCDWTHERDWMYVNLWGRLGYDPDTPDELFEAMVADKLGKAAAPLVVAWKAASRIISTAYSAFSLGPDHRNHAIELEWGGDTAGYLAAEPFDSHVFKSIKEDLADSATHALDGRLSPWETAARLESDAVAAAKAAEIPVSAAPTGEQKRLKELMTACVQASHLGRYYAERFRSAYRAGQAQAGMAVAAGYATYHMKEAEKEWSLLAACPYYKPFVERLRMRTNAYHWSQELPKIKAEAERLAKIAPSLVDSIAPVAKGSNLPELSIEIRGDSVKLSLPAAGIKRAWALIKPLPSSAFFHKSPMARRGESFAYEFKREPWGHSVAAEVEGDSGVHRLPGWEADAPYFVVPSQPGPTPLLYSSEEALNYLDPAVLSPSSHGLLLISSRAWNFHHTFSIPVERKILDPVKRGMTLVVLAQEYARGRYGLDWLPKPLSVETRREDVFDPSGALGLRKIEVEDILRQRFLASPGWEVPGNGGIAMIRSGKGRIILINARLIERLYVPACASTLDKVLSLGGHKKPVVVLDAGTEGAQFASSVVIDFMNARDIPFLTLGEVIARTQGTRAVQPIPGRMDDDDLLPFVNMNGGQMINRFLERKVKAAAALPAPASKEEFERRRETQRHELARCLGLDPLPPRTPLNAKVVGTIERRGYRIEKIVFESRPNFPVTAHLYVPDTGGGRKLPVIVNAHGHWGWKKQEPTVQARLIGQALRGYLAMVIDSPGYSFEGRNRVERRWAGPHDDLRLILGSENATSVYVWDLVRALDYLETRPEADMTRIGLTGASGGGLATTWAFAAEPRFACAVPVVYASSLEINPQNGCLCNHVPGSLQIGDRADVLGLRVPAPILIIGAEEDTEFPATGMRLSGEKLKKLWGLFGKSDDAWLRMFPGGHDYSRPMRETAIGFFDKYLRGVGNGSPVVEPSFETEPPDSPELYVLPNPPQNTLTMRGIAEAMFGQWPYDEAAGATNSSQREDSGIAARRMAARAMEKSETRARRAAESGTWPDFVRLNGGLPAAVPVELKKLGEADGKSRYVFVSEPGLILPAIVWPAKKDVKAFVVLVSDRGKGGTEEEFRTEKLCRNGITCIALDPRGLGELKDIDLRLTTYLGQSPAFGMGWDMARAITALVPAGGKVAIVGRGPAAGQAALMAAFIEPRVSFVAGVATLKEFADALRDDIPLISIQPRANFAPPLTRLRSMVKADVLTSFLGEPDPNWEAALVRWAGR
jgi:dienelactone hydrolase